MIRPILPGSTVGILGSGQIGRMMAQSARQLGYRVLVYSPESGSPAGGLADETFVAPYQDLNTVARFASQSDVVTFEFENVPATTAKTASEQALVRPSPETLFLGQNRNREKATAQRCGVPVTPFHPVRSLQDLEQASIHYPAVLKTASEGYDGKGQRRVQSLNEAKLAFSELGQVECVLEAFVPFVRELSVVMSRSPTKQQTIFPVSENVHENHMLDLSVWPARVSDAVAQRAVAYAQALAEAFDVLGTACAEFFETETGEVLFNEIAPRPHNSGHLSIEACTTSQFEQHLRAICGLPLGSTDLRKPGAALANLNGDLWSYGVEGAPLGEPPDWAGALREVGAHLHLYGKRVPRPGRKMGHITALGPSPEDALRTVQAARNRLIASA